MRKSTGHFTACAKAHDFSVAVANDWSKNSGAFVEGSEACGVSCPPPPPPPNERGVVQQVP